MSTPQTNGPESIVVSLEWAKKLKEAGWPQDHGENVMYWRKKRDDFVLGGWCVYALAAPTAEEILRRLPDTLENRLHEPLQIFRMMPNSVGWRMMYGLSHSADGDTLANAAAKMFVFLAKQKLLPTA